MKSLFLTTAPALLLVLAGTLGCDNGTETADERQLAAEQEAASEQEPAGKHPKQYPVHGKVVAVDREKPSVTLDHEAIKGLMKATQMEFRVASPQVLEAIAHGDRVQAQLVEKEGEFVITDLRQPVESSD